MQRETTTRVREDDDDVAPDVRESKRRRMDESDLFEISTERNLISDDSHYTDFGHGYSYDYISTTSSTISILGVPTSPPPTESSTRKCFNCNSPDHISSSCPLPRDPTAIAKNRTAFNDANPSMAGETTKLGSVSERERRLAFVERFEPGIVSEELREAMRWGHAEWPWLSRIAIWGYPPGWIIKEGDRHPMELAKDRIGRDLNFDNIELLHIFDDKHTDAASTPVSSSPVPSPPSSLSVVVPPTIPPIPIFAAPPLPLDAPPPLPLDAPPPLPPGPPPPIPPPPIPTIRLVKYQTRQFDWETLPVHRVRYPFPLLRSSSRVSGGIGDGQGEMEGRQSNLSLDLVEVKEEGRGEVDEGLSEGEMDISDEEE